MQSAFLSGVSDANKYRNVICMDIKVIVECRASESF